MGRERDDAGATWSIVLAGGDGRRLAALTRSMFGYDRPKQYCAFGDDPRPLLAQAIDRAELLSPRARIVVTTSASHRSDASSCLALRAGIHRVEQPANRNTTPGVLLPLLYVLERDPDATVAVLPSDHHVSDDRRFMAALDAVRPCLDDEIALLGVRPSRVECGLGWIVPQEWDGPWQIVRAFREKPSAEGAARLIDVGALVNTFAFIARGQALAQAIRDAAPAWWAALTDARGAADVAAVYADLPASCLSREVLQRVPDRLRVVPLEGVLWSDVGTPERLVASLESA